MYDLNYAIILPGFAFVVFFIAFIFSIKLKRTELKKSKFYNFIQLAIPMSILIVSVNMFVSGLNIEMAKKDKAFGVYKDAIANIYTSTENVLLDKLNLGLIRPEFYASFFTSNPQVYKNNLNIYTPPTSKTTATERYICIRVLQAFEDYLQYNRKYNIADPVWLAIFIKWGQSVYLQNSFDALKNDFDPSTVDFVNLLFEYGKKIPIPTFDMDEYYKIALELNEDTRLQPVYFPE